MDSFLQTIDYQHYTSHYAFHPQQNKYFFSFYADTGCTTFVFELKKIIMKQKLNWNFYQILKNEQQFLKLLLLSIGLLIITHSANAQNICKMRSSYFDHADTSQLIQNGYIYVGPAEINGVIGGDYPCDAKIAISVEDSLRYIFSQISAFNATMTPNDSIDYPGDNIGDNGKRAYNPMSIQKSFERIKDLKMGFTDGPYGKKWAITANQLKRLYPNNTFDVVLGGKPRTAFDQSNLFFEMLISVQVLAHKNEEQQSIIEHQTTTIERLNGRLLNIENFLNIDNAINPHKTWGDVSIHPNPNTNGILRVAYHINQTAKNVKLSITDIQGKQVYESLLNTMKNKGNQNIEIDLPAGTYLYYLESRKGKTEAQKLIIL